VWASKSRPHTQNSELFPEITGEPENQRELPILVWAALFDGGSPEIVCPYCQSFIACKNNSEI
jgi:hypothetical protein